MSTEARKQSQKRWRDNNREKTRAYGRKHYAANPEAYKDKERERRAKLTPEQHEALLARQRESQSRYRDRNPEKTRIATLLSSRRKQKLPEPTRPCPARCECCGCEAWLETFEFALDHSHTTGKFRGWLCFKCNTGLGHLGDNRDGLIRALAYLDRADGAR